jgi:D-xylose transport system substrate-binding protein
MLLVDYNGAAVGVAQKAADQGIPVIAYDRPFTGADYYVSFDNVEVGRLQGQTVLDGLEAAGVDPAAAAVFYMGGDPTDGNAAMFRSGAVEVMEAAGITAVAEPKGVWDGGITQTNFEQALTDNGGKVDGVWAANDTNADGVIKVLQDQDITGVAVSGQDANLEGLRNILTGWQTATVYKPVKLEADAAVEVAIALLNGETPAADQELEDGTPYIAVTPQLVGPNEVKDVVAAGDASADEICTGEIAGVSLADKCAEYGVQ